MNIWVITGHIGHDIEVKKTNSGVSVTSVRVAVDRQQSVDVRQAGDAKVTDWVTCIFWRGKAEYIAKYGKKGARVTVHGHGEARSYKDADGTERRVTELVVEDCFLADYKEKEAA